MDRWASLVFLIGLCSPGGPLARAAHDQLEHCAAADAPTVIAAGAHSFVVTFEDLPRARALDGEGSLPVEWEGVFEVGAGGEEVEILGAAAVGSHLFWLVRQAEACHLLAARSFERDEALHFAPAGPTYSLLLRDLRRDERLRTSSPASADPHPEGLADWHTHLLLALRDPAADGQALLVPIRNPEELARGGESPRLGEPIRLDLDGLGVRSLERWDERGLYLLVAGRFDEELYVLYSWSGDLDEKPKLIQGFDLTGVPARLRSPKA